MRDEWSPILEYWFGPVERLGLKNVKAPEQLWFGGGEEIDRDIERRFLPLMRRAAAGELDEWADQPESSLALILLLDQFPLNVFRDQARSFTWNFLALPYALKAIRERWDTHLRAEQRVFIYLPLEHAEDIHLQVQAVQKFRELVAAASPADRGRYASFLDYAERHERVIRRFGRFPDRNPILGRESTPEERHYLEVEGGPDF